RPAPPRDPGDRAPRAAGGSGLAFSAAQEAAAAELRGAGVSSGGFGIVSRVRAVALVVVAEEVGVAQDDQRDQRGKLGDDQSDGREQRPAGEAGAWDGGPDRQHGDAGADARAQRQLSAVGWGAVMTRLLEQAMAIPGAPAIVWRNHRRLAKKRALAIQYSRGKARKAQLYRDLIAATRATVAALQHAAQRLTACVSIEAELWRSQLRHYLPLIERVIDQAERRVLAG